MKKIIMLLFLLPLFLIAQTDGTWTTNAETTKLVQGKVIKFTFALDSAGTLTSNSWTVDEQDDFLWSTEPIQFAYKFTSSDSLPKITGTILGSMDNVNFVVIDTLFSNAVTETMTFGSTDMNSIHAPYLKLTLTGIELGAADQLGWLHIYHYQRRDEVP